MKENVYSFVGMAAFAVAVTVCMGWYNSLALVNDFLAPLGLEDGLRTSLTLLAYPTVMVSGTALLVLAVKVPTVGVVGTTVIFVTLVWVAPVVVLQMAACGLAVAWCGYTVWKGRGNVGTFL